MRGVVRSDAGFSLAEAVIAVGVLTVGALGLVGVFLQGMAKTTSSPFDLIATQKASEAVESVFSARDSHTIVWAQLRNVSQGGIFRDGPQALKTDGADGVVNTADDGVLETMTLPGRDQILGTGDDVIVTLDAFTREIKIVDLSDDLRSITVTVTYSTGKAGSSPHSYTLTAFISTYA
jgi:hypothetical protein